MVTRLKSVGVTVGPQTADKIDELANARGAFRLEAIQISADTGLSLLKFVMAFSADHAFSILKHGQLALPVERQCSEGVDQLLNQALSNVCECHA